MIGGVAGGLAEYFEIDPTIVRIIFIVTLFIGGGGFLAYIILWIVVPEEPFIFVTPDSSSQQTPPSEGEQKTQQTPQFDYESHRQKRRNFGGAILIVIGVLFLMDNFIPRFHFGDFWPLILIAIGIALIMKSKNN